MDDLVVPFMFVPDGAAPDEGWLARHPNWAKFPATLVWRYVDEPPQSAEVFEPRRSVADPDGIAGEWPDHGEATPSRDHGAGKVGWRGQVGAKFIRTR